MTKYLQDTCRTAAPELRHGPETQRTSVQKQTHLLGPLTFQFGLETINCLCYHKLEQITIRYDTRCYFNVRSKADISQLNLPHGTDN